MTQTPTSTEGSSELTLIQGQIERVAHYNDETDFAVLRVKATGYRAEVTLVGKFVAPTPGQVVRATGRWTNHPTYGEQFQMVSYTTLVPATVHGIEKYLGSGLIKGIGPVMAKRLVKAFGKDTLDVVENDSQRLAEVEGIGEKRVEMIRKAWEAQKEIREVMLFLQGHGVSSAYASKIYRHYGNQSIDVVKDNPYRLAMDIFGVGFLTADKIATNMGFMKDSPLRAEAGVIYVLSGLGDEGHVYYPYESLVNECAKILEAPRAIVERAVETLSSQRRVTVESADAFQSTTGETDRAVYLAQLYACEVGAAQRLKTLLTAPSARRKIDTEKAIAWVQGVLSISLAPQQAEAVRRAIEHKVMVITGGPGTGKTTIINAILKIFGRLGVPIMLAAPTGRAAKRMSEATGRDSKTIHRLLEFSPQDGGFQKNEAHPLETDLLVVDEASMIDTVLMSHLLKAVPPGASLILVGDVNQLPSVGPGTVLADIIASGKVPTVQLTEIFRQAKDSAIIVNAHLINSGIVPEPEDSGKGPSDFYFIYRETPEDALKVILELMGGRIQKAFGFDPLNDVQALTPMNRGTLGAQNLNVELQKILNPRGRGIARGSRSVLVGDKVMQIRNNYDKDVFNGDIGRIQRIDTENREVWVRFDGRLVGYDYSELDEIVPAYAITVHKSQGSEYPCVVMPLLTQHFLLLQRNLLYTAVTRGKKLVVIVGSRKALSMAVRNDKTSKRFTRLTARLRIATGS
jgi:exodeoxyribonuclease V alpha subunit